MKRALEIYKTPLLISVTLAIVFVGIKLETRPLEIVSLVIGSLLGTFLLDAEYFIYAFILEPAKPFSKNFSNFIRSKDLSNAMIYAHYNQADVEDKTLNSVLFQVALAGITIFAVSATVSTVVTAFLLSGFVNSIYRLIEKYYAGTTNEWFWALKKKPNQKQLLGYCAALIVVFTYCLTLL